MLLIFICLIFGVVAGYYLRSDSKLFLHSEKTTMMFVYALLVFMGMSTAQKDGFLELFTESGRIALFLATFGMLGSILLTLPIYLYFRSHRMKFWSFLNLHKANKNTAKTSASTVSEGTNLVFELRTNNSVEKENVARGKKFEILLPLAFYVAGVLISFFVVKVSTEVLDEFVLYALYALLFFTGIGIGKVNVIDLLKRYHLFIIIIPFLALVGSLLGGAVFNSMFGLSSLRECLAINAGMGYYSINAVINKSFLGDKIGLIALLANLFRETGTMLLCYYLVKIFGPLAPIATGGATTMDTTLPFIRKNASSEYALIAFFNGVVLTIVVPPLTTFIAGTTLIFSP